jgi:hypothetical protein
MRQGTGNARLSAGLQEKQEVRNCLVREVGDVGDVGDVGEESGSRSGELGKLRVGRILGERRDDREEGLEGEYACFKAGMDFGPGKCAAPEGRKLRHRHKQGGEVVNKAWRGVASASDVRGWGIVCMAILEMIGGVLVMENGPGVGDE